MANRNLRLITKQTSVPGRVPSGTTGNEINLVKQGELAINTADYKLYSFDGTGVFELGSKTYLNKSGGTVGSLNVTGDSSFSGSLSAETFFSGDTSLYEVISTIAGSFSGSSVATINSWSAYTTPGFFYSDFNHGLDTLDIDVSVYDLSDNRDIIPGEVERVDENIVRIIIDNNSSTLRVLVQSVGSLGSGVVSGGTGGDVIGPSSSTNNAIARFDGTTGKVLLNSNSTLDNSGNVYFSGDLSASTIYSAGTDLYDIFLTESSSGDITRVQPGTNTTTGGTDNFPEVNLVDSPSINNITVSGTGDFSTITSGGTDLGSFLLSSASTLNNLQDVNTGLPLNPTNSDDGKMLFFDVESGGFITDDSVNHGTVVINAKPSSLGTIAKGSPVFLDGGEEDDVNLVAPSNASSSVTMPIIGLAAEALISGGSKHVVTFGKITGLDTTSSGSIANGETWTEGDILYANIIDGTLTNLRPTGSTTEIQRVCQVLKVNSNSGSLFVFNTARTAGLPNLDENKIWIGNSGGTPVQVDASDYETNVQDGLNTYTGGTSNLPTVNVSALTIDNITVSGDSSFESFSATTIISGTTDLYDIFLTDADGNDITRVQPGTNTTTGGTDNLPEVNIVDSPSLNNLTVSGTGEFGTITSGGTDINNYLNNLSSDISEKYDKTGGTISGNVFITGNLDVNGTATTLNTEIVRSHDNNIELNFDGNHNSALGGGVTVLSGVSNTVDSTITVDGDGKWSASTEFFAADGLDVINGSVMASGGTDLYGIFMETAVYDKGNDGIVDKAQQIRFKAELNQTAQKGNLLYGVGRNPSTGLPIVGLADNTVSFADNVVGMCAESGTSSSTIEVIKTGVIEGINTSSYSVGENLYLSTFGNFDSKSNITSGNFNPIGVVINSSSNGVILVDTMSTESLSNDNVINESGVSGRTTADALNHIDQTKIGSISEGSNIELLGSASSPEIKLSDSPSVNNITVSGTGEFDTITSGGTDLYNIFSTNGGGSSGDVTRVQPGLNTFTGGTENFPEINVSALTIDSLSVSGETSLGSLSATTILSGDTNLYDIFATESGSGTFQKISHTISGWQSSNYTESFSHGFGNVPDFINIVAVCTSNISGYVVGEEIDLKAIQNYVATAAIGFNLKSDSSNVEYIGANNANPLRAWGKNTGNSFSLSDSDWDIRIDAYKGGIEATVPVPRVSSTSSTGSLTIDASNTDTQVVSSLSQAMTINAPSGTPFIGQRLVIRIKDDGTARALTWDSAFRLIGVTALPTTTVSNKLIYVGCIYNALDTKWDVIAYNLEQ